MVVTWFDRDFFVQCCMIRIKSGEPGILGFSVPGRLGGVICKPEGAVWGLVKTPLSLRARK